MPAERRCRDCGQPMLPRGEKRLHKDDYRHARGCPRASEMERRATEAMWAHLERKARRGR